MDRRVRIAAALVGAGLFVEILVLRGVHPSAFLIFVLAGIPLVAAGVLVFLYSGFGERLGGFPYADL